MRSALLFLALLPAMVTAQEANPDSVLKQAIDEQQHGNFPAAIRDYRKVLELRPRRIYPAHGGPLEPTAVERWVGARR